MVAMPQKISIYSRTLCKIYIKMVVKLENNTIVRMANIFDIIIMHTYAHTLIIFTFVTELLIIPIK